jgi:hypothetical protein
MSNKITIKRSSQPGKVPEPSDLDYGEFALNYTDGNLFFKSNANVITNLVSTKFVSVTGNVQGGNIVSLGAVSATGNVSGNYFVGNGAFLTGIGGSGVLTSAVDNFVGDGSTTEFILSTVPASENLTSVNIDGVSQLKSAYSVVGNVLTFSSAPPVDAEFEVTVLSGTVMTLANLTNGTTVIDIPVANGNATISVAGTANVMVITGTGANVAGTLSATGNVTGNYILGNGSQLTGLPEGYTNANVAAYLPTYTGNLASLTGAVTTTANITGNYILGNGSQLTSINKIIWTTQANTAPANANPGDFWYNSNTQIKYQYINTGTSNVWVDQSSPTVFTSITTGQILNANANGVGNIGSDGASFDTVFAKATSAQYADLAENYQADAVYAPGTVVVFGGEFEITQSCVSHDSRVAGVVSTDPAFLMNSAAHGLPVALTGRVPCQVQGPVDKGDLLTTSDVPGTAQKLKTWAPGCVIGKSLEIIKDSSVKTIEIAVGRF